LEFVHILTLDLHYYLFRSFCSFC